MAATDKNYRDQYALDIVFAVSCILMLVSIVWMFMDDYNREFKEEQRRFRDVEAALAQRMALDQMPGTDEFDAAKKAVAKARQERESKKDEIDKLRSQITAKLPEKEESDKKYQTIKADLDSISSFYDIEVEEHGSNSAKAKSYRDQITVLKTKESEAKAEKDAILAGIKDHQAKVDVLEKPLTDALSNWKKVDDKFDAQVKLAITKQWGWGDWFRALPVIDGFASPIKVHQFTIKDVTIDYNFAQVTRFDRCMTCHQAIDKPAFAKGKVQELTRIDSDYDGKLAEARKIMYERRQALKGLPERASLPKWTALQLTRVPKTELTEARVNEYCAHPRLDLFVGSNSKHPAEKFGCTSCHSGQGSATSFTLASHTPNNSVAKDRWTKEHDWEAIHMWDFPMHPLRFVESSCLKCHHQVTDLIGQDNRNEAPKLMRGYNLIKENGCFGCHEIAGRKAGKQIGPDLRLEGTPPLEDLSPAERTKIESDPETMPGNLRKVGPSLYRVSEKVGRDWTAKWLRSPRGFRPDTKMPHFYGLSNNDEKALEGTGQEKFPDTEIWAATHYLFEASDGYLKDVAAAHKIDPAAWDKAQVQLNALELKVSIKAKLTDKETKELDTLTREARLRKVVPLRDIVPGYKGKPEAGRILFSERGCLACHSHDGTHAAQLKPGDSQYAPAVMGEALFGPNLSQLKAKLMSKKDDEERARKWLIQWVLQPQIHSPRSRMPITHLTPTEAADIAAWLLAQEPTDLGEDWKTLTVKEPGKEELHNLARVYLVRLLSKVDMNSLLEKGTIPAEVASDLPVEEKELARSVTDDTLKRYLGKKAIGRLGCFACHDIPGFDATKPIGVGLNDWGKKAADRLAFEDINNYLAKHFHVVPSLTDEDGKPVRPVEQDGEVKMPYEKFFADALVHHQREGYLNQKILDPRSYDYKRLRTWDDRSRMPQFRFARSHQKKGESRADFVARANKEEAEAREAVMTFVLGLVAEPLPSASVYQPKGDRLAEVKGRQVLDKFNCAGCHLIRPGVFDLKVTKETTTKLDQTFAIVKNRGIQAGDHTFLNHANWVGKNPTSADRLTAQAVKPRLLVDDEDPNLKTAQIRLTRALRFLGADKTMKDIDSANVIQLAPENIQYPPPPAWESKESLNAFLKDKGPYGGTFADLLVDYLIDKDKASPTVFYAKEGDGDSSKARAAVPPILLGQGERTQTEWLYEFLLNPTQIRKMTVLRMPKFNMSKEEARILVDYFAAVERYENPGVGLNYPYETILQKEDLKEEFWLLKNAEYVARLKQEKLLDKRLESLKPIWQQILKDFEAREADAKAKKDLAKTRLDEATKALEAEKDNKDKQKVLEAAKKDAEQVSQAWETEWKTLAEAVKSNSLEGQKLAWETREGYLNDAFKILTNRGLCLQCHQVGNLTTNNQIQGPPLHLAHQRLRPGWLERWIASPQRFLTYATAMPNNFPADKVAKDAQYQELMAGPPLDQVIAVRDLLMNYPRAAALPVNHYTALPLPEGKNGEKK